MKQKIDKRTVYLGLGFLVLGLLLGWVFFGGESEAPVAEGETELAHDHEGEGTIWTCAMHPQIRMNEPGQCPICGMDLIPLKEGGATVSVNEIQMTESAIQLANVQTTVVQQAEPTKEVYLPGKVKAEETAVSDITARFPGRIERLYVNFTGQEVKKGQLLASIYSPELITAQKELQVAARLRETNPSFYESAVRKLRLWNLSDAQISRIAGGGKLQDNLNIYAPQSGTVVAKNVNVGEYVTEGQPLFQVTGLDDLWVLFDAYESELPWIEVGDEIRFTVQSLPGEVFTSKVTFIDPVINPGTRAASVRTEVKNENGKLKPDMFAQGVLQSELDVSASALMIPRTAVLWTGKRAVVYVKNPAFDQPTFEFREVELGPEAGGMYVVNSGLRPGEEVVTNGVFQVDAAAQLQGKVSMMNPSADPGAAAGAMAGMPGMDMPAAGGAPSQTSTFKYVEGDVVDLRGKVPAAFKKQLNDVVDAYLLLKEALVEADETETAKYSTALLVALQKVDDSVLEGEAKAFWEEKKAFLLQHTKLCKEADTIEGKRENFIFLSQPLIKIVEAFGARQTLYVDYCPMVKAYWLSEVEEIRNPYMPQMLTCGEVKDVIKP
ncbi:Cu(I)/Ag(I) efflux system membrane fusion protein [Pontibacter ummariensis]|uniref:Membrane fusion protein, Cu(I)/Ag(I) efflux system n=1 Tax=Pontibacter ummariensis TaxID=1610492 RepID=A0A239DQ62_9BACT|nr:efflux RND transporter periplasmic adaptor subunit [Pontibacter ummariensis]PRY13824.1 Cu(I)/Ag(I) efflux system membrane fusion protein [Pontibacter ummariensis]SNS34221.1 membrane fusion protein, Cu(I)/Ag(I) efflux system [Pontibacter ummariensis]